ncbi:hypothetical protein Ahy_A09g044566 [Arachis hypogaea]|uniref:MULE transposase domain-containing protein n=1 Tax=Arachis hypogaea TaxID=3818 RepID=A0A445BKC9_ARAHY|nr:hypothetical protein Ahy_A09g044566 [Arachis hypogaea]
MEIERNHTMSFRDGCLQSRCINPAFKHCKILIFIDVTPLYGKYKRTLLMAIMQDGNTNILPIIFAVVKGETREAWSFFLTYLRKQVTPQPYILVISDRYNSIYSTLNTEENGWHALAAFQAFCAQHVLVSATYLKSHTEFTHYFDWIRSKNQVIANWLDEMPRSHKAQYANEGHRFGHITTNISKCINAIMKAMRYPLISSFVKLMGSELFAKKDIEAQAQLYGGVNSHKHL